jgi:hypothetical protein
MKKFFIFAFVLFCISAYAQEVTVLEFNEESQLNPGKKVERFESIDPKLNLTKHERIAVLSGYSVNSGRNTLRGLFSAFWEKSNSLGANAFIVDKVERVGNVISVQISVYYLDDTTLEYNLSLYPTNMVYVFGDLDVQNRNRRIRLNGERIEIAPLEFIAHQNHTGERARVSIGGFTGARVDIQGAEGRLPMYLSLSGFGVGVGGNVHQPGIQFNTGRIYPVEMNLGQFLLSVLTKK